MKDLMLAALDADAAYAKELRRVYGPKTASDARYRFRHEDPACQAAAETKIAADERWLAALGGSRK